MGSAVFACKFFGAQTGLSEGALRQAPVLPGHVDLLRLLLGGDQLEMAYVNYEAARRLPKLDILVRIADMYKVSLDYLAGRTDDPRPI